MGALETVWKIRIGAKLEPDESVKRSEKAQSLPRCATKDVPSSPLSQFPNSFSRTFILVHGIAGFYYKRGAIIFLEDLKGALSGRGRDLGYFLLLFPAKRGKYGARSAGLEPAALFVVILVQGHGRTRRGRGRQNSAFIRNSVLLKRHRRTGRDTRLRSDCGQNRRSTCGLVRARV